MLQLIFRRCGMLNKVSVRKLCGCIASRNQGTIFESFTTKCCAVNNGHNFTISKIRNYSKDNKYDVTNPFAEESMTEETENVMIETRKPAGYFSSLFQVWRTPAPAMVTGLAGLIPFVAPPAYLYFSATSFQPFFISAQLAYGAVILSFIGGLRWGFVIPYRHGSVHMVTWRSIIQSTVPALIAWGGLLLPDLTGGLLMVSAGLLLALYNDLRLFGDYPKWMLGLRCLLTTVAITMLIASVVFVEENRLNNSPGKRTQNKLLENKV